MLSTTLRAERRVGAAAPAHANSIARRLGRFDVRHRNAVHVLAARHPRLADLALSFPALLFALAVPRRSFAPEPAIARVIDGAPLAEIARVARLPLWLRRLPPEAFVRPIEDLPDGELFRRQIANHLPRQPKLASVWLQAVADAAAWGHEALAVWIARELTRDARAVKLDRLRPIALWAWYSLQPATHVRISPERPWSPRMRFTTAVASADRWFDKVELYLNVGDTPIADMWMSPAEIDGYAFVPLRTHACVAAEASAMRNCLLGYGYNVAHNRSRLWSVRRDGLRVATLEIAKGRGQPLLGIRQLQAIDNKPAPAEVWWAACRWLLSHNVPQIETQAFRWEAAPLDRAAWTATWRPFWLAKRCIPDWLPLAPSRRALKALQP